MIILSLVANDFVPTKLTSIIFQFSNTFPERQKCFCTCRNFIPWLRKYVTRITRWIHLVYIFWFSYIPEKTQLFLWNLVCTFPLWGLIVGICFVLIIIIITKTSIFNCKIPVMFLGRGFEDSWSQFQYTNLICLSF